MGGHPLWPEQALQFARVVDNSLHVNRGRPAVIRAKRNLIALPRWHPAISAVCRPLCGPPPGSHQCPPKASARQPIAATMRIASRLKEPMGFSSRTEAGKLTRLRRPGANCMHQQHGNRRQRRAAALSRYGAQPRQSLLSVRGAGIPIRNLVTSH